jgi:hypothetical protein
MTQTEQKENFVTAFEPKRTMCELIGESIPLSNIFTDEKIAACQKVLDSAKASFFHSLQQEMGIIHQAMNKKKEIEPFKPELFIWLNNTKGESETLGFLLISKICHYLIEFCQAYNGKISFTDNDELIITKLFEALRHTIAERVLDTEKTIEKELVSLVSKAKGFGVL